MLETNAETRTVTMTCYEITDLIIRNRCRVTIKYGTGEVTLIELTDIDLDALMPSYVGYHTDDTAEGDYAYRSLLYLNADLEYEVVKVVESSKYQPPITEDPCSSHCRGLFFVDNAFHLTTPHG